MKNRTHKIPIFFLIILAAMLLDKITAMAAFIIPPP